MEVQPLSTMDTNDHGSGPHGTRPQARKIESSTEVIDGFVVPDSGYYQEAIRLVEGHRCGHDLLFAHVYLLAGLYKAQCARVGESRACFRIAGNKLYGLISQLKLLIDNSDYRAQSTTQIKLITNQQLLKGGLVGPILMSAWSCLQLETDSSGKAYSRSSYLHRIIGKLPLPPDPCESKNTGVFSPNDQHCHESNFQDYLALTFANRQLRLFRHELYGYGHSRLALDEIQNSFRGLEEISLDWRNTLPRDLKWLDGDKATSCVFEARLRAKYYQTMYRIHLPHLDFALNILPHLGYRRTVREIAVGSHGKFRDEAEVRLLEAIYKMDVNETHEACRRCIEAATQIVTAFDGVSNN